MTKKKFDYSSLREPLDAEIPVQEPIVTPPPVSQESVSLPRLRIDDEPAPMAKSNQSNVAWLVAGVLAILLVFVLVVQFRGCIADRGGDDTVVVDRDFDIDGVAVLVLEDTNRNPRDRWKRGQVMTVQTVRDWSADKVTQLPDGAAYRNIDVAEDISKLDPFWTKLKSKAKLEPPTVLVVNRNRLTEFKLPEDDKEAIAALEKATGR